MNLYLKKTFQKLIIGAYFIKSNNMNLNQPNDNPNIKYTSILPIKPIKKTNNKKKQRAF